MRTEHIHVLIRHAYIVILEQAHIVVLWLPGNPLNSMTRLRLFGFPLSVNHRPFWPPDDSQLSNE